MLARRAAEIVAVAALSSCDVASQSAPKPDASYGPLATVPPAFLGTWILDHQSCEADSEQTPDPHPPHVQVDLRPDHTYFMTIEGWPAAGTYTVEHLRSGDRAVFDITRQHFELNKHWLENWSEGDAPYLCGNIFRRAG